MKNIERKQNKINSKINIDKKENINYNKEKIAIFTYENYLEICNKDKNNLNLKDQESEYVIDNIRNITINNKHDKIFRTILDKKKEAVVIINKVLMNPIKLTEIEKYNSSFITSIFQNQESDIVYKNVNNNIFYLIEHQTKIDYTMAFRMLKYTVEIIQSATRDKNMNIVECEYPIVIPIVLYTGHRKWNAKTNMVDIQFYNKFDKRNCSFEYNLIDINEYTEEKLLEENSFISKMMLIEKAKTKEELIKNIEKISKIIQTKEESNFLIKIIELTLKNKLGENNTKKLEEKIMEGVDENMLAVVEMMDREYQNTYLSGKMEGKKETKISIIKTMIQKRIPIKLIEEITNTKKEEIMKLLDK